MKPFGVLCALILLAVGRVSADTCSVPGGYLTIQSAVDDVLCTDILLAAGTYNEAVVVDRDLVLRGPDRFTTFIQDTLTVNNDAVLSLKQVSVQFSSSHGVILDSKFAELDGDDIEIAFNSGFGVHYGPLASDSVVNVRNCDIHDNQRGIQARFIQMDNCNVSFNLPQGGIDVRLGGTILNSSIFANEHTSGNADGGGVLFYGPGGTALTIEDSTLSGNFANNSNAASNTADGGGIMVRQGVLFLRRSDVLGNVTGRYGGGIATSDTFGAVATIEDSNISGNLAYGSGGGIGAGDRTEVSNSLIENNRVRYQVLVNSNGTTVGGGIHVFEDKLTLTDSTVRLNTVQTESGTIAVNSGGGIYINTDQPVTIERSTISGNFAEQDGGGLFVASNTTLINSTVAANRANRDGGGIFGQFSPLLMHGTVAQNTADDDNDGDGDGGGIFGAAQVSHTLIGDNTDKSTLPLFHPDCSGSAVSSGYSLLGISDGCPAFDGGAGNQSGTAGLPLDLLLLPLAGNSGPTQTVATDEFSPAVDGGETGCELVTTVDQRGFSRLSQDGNGDGGTDGDPCDIGAFETFSGCQGAPLVLSNIVFTDTQTLRSESTLTTGESVVIDPAADITFESGDVITLGPGFQARAGSVFLALVTPVSCSI